MFLHSGLHQGECLSTEQGVVALRVTMLTQKLAKLHWNVLEACRWLSVRESAFQ